VSEPHALVRRSNERRPGAINTAPPSPGDVGYPRHKKTTFLTLDTHEQTLRYKS